MRILLLLEGQPQCVEALATTLAVPQPRVSRHLAYLRRAGLVAPTRQGRFIYYELVKPREPGGQKVLTAVYRWLADRPEARADRARLARWRRG